MGTSGLVVRAIVAFALLGVSCVQGASQQVTANALNDTWGPRHGTTSQGKVLWAVDLNSDNLLDDVLFFDGTSTSTVQLRGALDQVTDSVFVLGTGPAPGDVIGAWRRGDRTAWIWTRTAASSTTLTDLKYTNPINAANPMNPEAVDVADGCIFMVLQFTGGKAHVYRVDPASGTATNLTGNADVPGATSASVTTSGCKAAWRFNDGTGTDKLHFYNGSTVTQIDSNPGTFTITDPHLSQGRIVYGKTISGITQIFLYDSTLASPSPVQLTTDASGQNSFPRTDGRHVAWIHTEADGTTHNVVLNGGIRLTTDASSRPAIPFGFQHLFQLQRGQLLWRDAGGAGRYYAGGRLSAIDALPATSFDTFWLADGFVAWLGASSDGGADKEVFRLVMTAPSDAAQPAAPMVVRAAAGTRQATVSWDRVIGASSYNVYMALQPGVTKDNYQTLPSGTRYTGVSNPFTATGLTDRGTYHFVVTAVEGATEGPSSPEAQASLTSNLTWAPASGLPAVDFKAVAGDRANAATAYASSGSAVYKSTDSGSTWTALAGGIENRDIRALAADGPRVYAVTRQGDILRSLDSGASWTVVADGADIGEQNKALTIDPLTPATLYAGNLQLPSKAPDESYVVRSIDGGATWSHVKEAPGLGSEIRAYALVVDPVANGALYASGTGTPNLARSANGGTTWTAVQPANGFVYALTADSRQATSLYAAMMNVSQSASLGILKSTKEGAAGSWIAKNTGLPGTLPRINFLLADPRNPSYLHAATEAGYFFSLDAAENWTAANASLTDTYINKLTLTGSRRLLAATSSGVFVLDLSAPFTPPPARVRADFDGDGKSDILWRENDSGLDAIWKMDGTTLAASALIPSVTAAGWTIAGVGDFNGDRKADILWRNTSTGENAIWLMDGFTLTSSALIVSVPDLNWTIAGVGDFDGDGKSDILWRNAASGDNAIWLMNGTSLASGALIPAVAATGWAIVGNGDFDGDGKTDILWRNSATGENAIWLMNGFTLASSALIRPVTDAGWIIAGVNDFDGDGKRDILWRNTASGDNAIWLMNGVSLASGALIPAVAAPGWAIVGTGDFNGDGKADILWRNTATGDNAIWLMNGVSLASGALIPAVPTSWSIVNTR